MHPMTIPTANPDLPHGVTPEDVEGEETYERPDPRIDAEYEEPADEEPADEEPADEEPADEEPAAWE